MLRRTEWNPNSPADRVAIIAMAMIMTTARVRRIPNQARNGTGMKMKHRM